MKLFQFNGQLNSLTCKVEFMQGQGGRVGRCENEEDCSDLLTPLEKLATTEIRLDRFADFNEFFQKI